MAAMRRCYLDDSPIWGEKRGRVLRNIYQAIYLAPTSNAKVRVGLVPRDPCLNGFHICMKACTEKSELGREKIATMAPTTDWFFTPSSLALSPGQVLVLDV